MDKLVEVKEVRVLADNFNYIYQNINLYLFQLILIIMGLVIIIMMIVMVLMGAIYILIFKTLMGIIKYHKLKFKDKPNNI